MAGQLLGGRYELVERLAAPGRRVVWAAYDRQAERTVAVQVLAGAGPTAEDAARLVEGARAAAVLAGHPNVLAVLDAGLDNGSAYLVTDHVAGRGLDEVLAADGVPDVARAADWAAQVCAGLAAGHAAGLLHGDIKPANLLLAADGTLRILDFGLAGAGAAQEAAAGADTALGSVPWMSPEQVRGGGAEADHRSDLYAVGCLLHQLLTGATPFGDREVTLQFAAQLREAPVAPGRQRAGVPAGLDALVLGLLAKDPADRPQAAAEVATGLTALAREAEAAPGTSDTPGAAVADAVPAPPAVAGFPAAAHPFADTCTGP
ncbi:serine/threonine-protein kinase, partial [Kitasatospora sp. NPDC059571]|uniref:serine/threonine-protein kinase n=1 Tax=Kitasatospora sp. NPDC059571 TaxID=3346871 RepID=UPI0036997DE2